MARSEVGACLALLLIATSISGCAGWQQKIARFEQNAAAKECDKAGWTVDTGRHEECIRNTVAAWDDQQKRDTQELLLGGLLVAGVIGAAQGAPIGYTGSQSSQQANTATAPTFGNTGRLSQCPDGTYVIGPTCYLVPDGTYHGQPPSLAPDGSYVAGKPTLAPNGQYVGGTGDLIVCPNGSYVRGRRCLLAPDGSYIGGQ